VLQSGEKGGLRVAFFRCIVCPLLAYCVEKLEILMKPNFSQSSFLSKMRFNTFASGKVKSCVLISGVSYGPSYLGKQISP